MSRPGLALPLVLILASSAWSADEKPAPISERARKVHDAGMLFDGHNDLPWRLREDGDLKFETLDLSKRLPTGQTDIPRMREGGLKAQFWSVYIPSEHPNPARTVTEQIDIVHRMVERYPDDLELALSADDVTRIVKAGKVASLIGIEGGIAIENDLAQLRAFHRLGARYMTLTHSKNIPWADSATDAPSLDGLNDFGRQVVREMNRIGMIVDLSHVSEATMKDALAESKAPVMFSHSGVRAVNPHPRNVPDSVLPLVKANGGIVMVVFLPSFLDADVRAQGLARTAEQARLKAMYPGDPASADAGLKAWDAANPVPTTNVRKVADHIDHLKKTIGVDHIGVGGDYDGMDSAPVGMEDVSGYPALFTELARRGYSQAELEKIASGNMLRVLKAVEAYAASQKGQPPVETPVAK
jgi:membrane dipeptidase